jgi:thiol-disulfide isomerase/thioredoxin
VIVAEPIEWVGEYCAVEVPMRFYLAAFALIGLFCAAATPPLAAQSSPAKPSAKAGAGANLPLIDLAGYHRILEKYKGKPLLVTFWATWCEPCRDEFPTLVALAEQYKPQGLSVFGVSLDSNADMHVVRHFLAEFRPSFPNYRQDPQIDVDEFYHGVNPQWEGSMPETILYTRDGRIAVHYTAEQTRQTFEQAIRAILGTKLSGNRSSSPSPAGN